MGIPLRAVLDASPTAALLVQSDGVMCHANKAARELWNGTLAGVDECFIFNRQLSVSVPQCQSEKLHCSSWEDVIEPSSFIDDVKTVSGVRLQNTNNPFHAAINVARVNAEDFRRVHFASDDNGGDQYFYCLYIQEPIPTPALPQRTPPQNKAHSPSSSGCPSVTSTPDGPSLSLSRRLSFQLEREEHNDIILGILDASFHALFVINDECIIQMVNTKSSQVFGWTKEEFIGQNINILMTSDVASAHDKYVKNYLRTGIKKMIGTQREVLARRKDGTTFPAALGLAEPKGQSGLICGFIRDLTTEKAAQEVIIKEQLLTSGIIDASFDGLFVISDHGIIQRVNKASCELFGWSQDEFLGQNIRMIMTQTHAEKHDDYLLQYLQTGVKKMIGKKRELETRRKDGSTFPCILGLKEVITNGTTQFVGFVRDITAEKDAMKAVEAEQNLLSKILDASFDSLLVINETGILQYVNEAAIKTFGWSRKEFLGKNINIIMPPLHAEKHDSYIQKYIATGFKKMIDKQREVESMRKDGSTFPSTLGLAEVFHNGTRLFVGFIKDVSVQKALLVANAEREASDELLYNILPVHIADRLKEDPSHIADQYDNTTILFADIVDFTNRTSKMTPHDVVTMLNDLFSRFDYLVGMYDLNKVKTIGDCYMVSSIPSSEIEHDGCARVCRFALDLMKAVQGFNDAGPQHGPITLRVGISCGSVVAGVVGTKRYLFDMWGDAVNVASRMESHGIPGQIQVTQDVVTNAGSDFSFQSRGMIQVKGKGAMEGYILKSARPVRHSRSVYDPYSVGYHTPYIRSTSNDL